MSRALPPTLPDLPELQLALEQARLAAAAPGAVIGVQCGDSKPLLLASGLSDISAGTEAQIGDSFSAGSVTKPLIAALTLRLCSERVISLAASPAEYGIDIPHGAEISLQQLLSHTSGVFNFGNDLYGKPLPLLKAFAAYPWSFEDVRQIIASHAPDFAPGTDAKYSNSNYIILGQMVERATGQRLGSLLRRHVIDPLQLSNTRYAADEAGPWPSMRGYLQAEWGGDDVTELDTYSLFGPGGGIISSAGDLLRLQAALEAGELLSGEWQALLLRRVNWDSTGTSGLSCGLQHFRRNWGSFRGHGGNTHGYTAGMWCFADEAISIAFGLNRAYVRERSFIEPLLKCLRASVL